MLQDIRLNETFWLLLS